MFTRRCFHNSCRRLKHLSHVDSKTNLPNMVNVADKALTSRTASAQAVVLIPKEVAGQLHLGEADVNSKKGPVFATAIIAGVMAAKQTANLIPFCHPIALEACDIQINTLDNDQSDFPKKIVIRSEVKTTNKTGVEMEALVAASHAALTVYDMLKALSHGFVISDIRLLSKTGGKSDLDLESNKS